MTFDDDHEYGVRHRRRLGVDSQIYECDKEHAELLYNSDIHGDYFVVVSRPKQPWTDTEKVDW
jgi:hypothetical protein